MHCEIKSWSTAGKPELSRAKPQNNTSADCTSKVGKTWRPAITERETWSPGRIPAKAQSPIKDRICTRNEEWRQLKRRRQRLNMHHISRDNRTSKDKTCHIQINCIDVEAEPDSGSDANIMDEYQFKQLQQQAPQHVEIKDTKIKLKTLREGLREADFIVSNQTRSVDTTIVIIQGTIDSLPLIGRKTLEELGVLIIDASGQLTTPNKDVNAITAGNEETIDGNTKLNEIVVRYKERFLTDRKGAARRRRCQDQSANERKRHSNRSETTQSAVSIARSAQERTGRICRKWHYRASPSTRGNSVVFTPCCSAKAQESKHHPSMSRSEIGEQIHATHQASSSTNHRGLHNRIQRMHDLQQVRPQPWISPIYTTWRISPHNDFHNAMGNLPLWTPRVWRTEQPRPVRR